MVIICWSALLFLLDWGRIYIEPYNFIIDYCYSFVDLVRNIIDSFNNAYGLFQDVWATMVEACINIGCSIWFGYLWGLPGILVGVLLSLLLIIFLWKPYFLFGWGFKISVLHYWKLYFKCFVSGVVTVCICCFCFLS